MLRRIGLENFKCWKELDIELAPITLFFGTNSSGKTAILQSLLMLKQTVASRDPNTHLNFGGGPRDYVDLGSYRDLVFGHDTGNSVGLNLSWDLSHEAVEELAAARWVEAEEQYLYPSMSFRYEVAWASDSGVFVKELGYKFIEDGQGASKVELIREAENQYHLTHFELGPTADSHEYMALKELSVGAPENCHRIRNGFRLQIAGNHVTTSTTHVAWMLEDYLYRLFYLGPLREYPKRSYQWTGDKKLNAVEPDGADTIATLISSAQSDQSLHNEVAKQLEKLELVDSFEVRPVDHSSRIYEVVVSVKSQKSALLDIGFGISQVLPVVTMLLSAPKGSIILLEQPELHLHPNAQAALADLMLYAAETRNLQLIIESHSEHILRRLQRCIAEAETEFANPENIKMYFCDPGEDGSTISEVEVDRFGQIANWPTNFLGDISGDLHTMAKAAIRRRREELASE